jgi:hypothetical protein
MTVTSYQTIDSKKYKENEGRKRRMKTEKEEPVKTTVAQSNRQ